MDRILWQDQAAQRQVGAFVRFGANPSNRGSLSVYADAGITVKAPFHDRTDDVVGIAVAVARVGRETRATSEAVRRISGVAVPIPDAEAVIEATYRFQATPWWILQPDLQFIRHPGGHVALSSQTVKAIPNATVMGLRSAILF
jgi:porin